MAFIIVVITIAAIIVTCVYRYMHIHIRGWKTSQAGSQPGYARLTALEPGPGDIQRWNPMLPYPIEHDMQ